MITGIILLLTQLFVLTPVAGMQPSADPLIDAEQNRSFGAASAHLITLPCKGNHQYSANFLGKWWKYNERCPACNETIPHWFRGALDLPDWLNRGKVELVEGFLEKLVAASQATIMAGESSDRIRQQDAPVEESARICSTITAITRLIMQNDKLLTIQTAHFKISHIFLGLAFYMLNLPFMEPINHALEFWHFFSEHFDVLKSYFEDDSTIAGGTLSVLALIIDNNPQAEVALWNFFQQNPVLADSLKTTHPDLIRGLFSSHVHRYPGTTELPAEIQKDCLVPLAPNSQPCHDALLHLAHASALRPRVAKGIADFFIANPEQIARYLSAQDDNNLLSVLQCLKNCSSSTAARGGTLWKTMDAHRPLIAALLCHNNKNIRTATASFLNSGIWRSPEAGRITWQILRENDGKLLKRLEREDTGINRGEFIALLEAILEQTTNCYIEEPKLLFKALLTSTIYDEGIGGDVWRDAQGVLKHHLQDPACPLDLQAAVVDYVTSNLMRHPASAPDIFSILTAAPHLFTNSNLETRMNLLVMFKLFIEGSLIPATNMLNFLLSDKRILPIFLTDLNQEIRSVTLIILVWLVERCPNAITRVWHFLSTPTAFHNEGLILFEQLLADQHRDVRGNTTYLLLRVIPNCTEATERLGQFLQQHEGVLVTLLQGPTTANTLGMVITMAQRSASLMQWFVEFFYRHNDLTAALLAAEHEDIRTNFSTFRNLCSTAQRADSKNCS